MGMFDFLRAKKNTAETAKNRLQIIIAQERTSRGAPDYLPLLQRELLEVIRKYVSVDERFNQCQRISQHFSVDERFNQC